jgi:hypothetical protein
MTNVLGTYLGMQGYPNLQGSWAYDSAGGIQQDAMSDIQRTMRHTPAPPGYEYNLSTGMLEES